MTILSEVKKVTDELELVIGRSIRAALETDGNPGNSVNATPNPLQLAVSGYFDLLKVAKRVRADIEAFLEDHASRMAKITAEADAALKRVEAAVHNKADEVENLVKSAESGVVDAFSHHPTTESATQSATQSSSAPSDAPGVSPAPSTTDPVASTAA